MAEERIITLTDKQKLEEKLDQLKLDKQKVTEDISIARGHGDLSENAEYHAAKEKQAEIQRNMDEIEETLRYAKVVDDSSVGTDTVALGTVVTVRNTEDGSKVVYTMVGITEANPRNRFISQESPVGKALMDRKIGEIAEVELPGKRKRNLEILKIEKR